MQQLSSQLTAENEANDSLVTSGRLSVVNSRSSILVNSSDGSASAAAAGAAEGAADAAAEQIPGARVSAATSELLDQMSGLQQLMQAEAARHQEVYGDTLEVGKWIAAAVAAVALVTTMTMLPLWFIFVICLAVFDYVVLATPVMRMLPALLSPGTVSACSTAGTSCPSLVAGNHGSSK